MANRIKKIRKTKRRKTRVKIRQKRKRRPSKARTKFRETSLDRKNFRSLILRLRVLLRTSVNERTECCPVFGLLSNIISIRKVEISIITF